MGRNKYFLLITNDACTSLPLLKRWHLLSMQSLDYLKTSVPLPCLKLLNGDINIMQLVYSTDEKLSKFDTELDIQWVTDVDNVPVKQYKSSSYIAIMLHRISESLPHLGSYDITIFCDGPLFHSKPQCHWELFNALLRFSHWCMADIVCLSNETELNLGPNWDKVIRVDKNHENAKDISLWKGNVIVKPGFWFTRFKLVFDTEEKWNDFPVNVSDAADTDTNTPYCVSHQLELLQECDKLTVPSYLIYPTKLKLKPFYGKGKENEQSPLVKHMRGKLEIGVLARLSYYPVSDSTEKLELTTKLWHEALLDNKYRECLKDQCRLPNEVSYINILIFANNETEDDVLSCFVLRNPKEMNSTFFEAVLTPFVVPAHQEDIEIASKIFTNMPKFSPQHWKDLEDEIIHIKKKNEDEMTIDQRTLKYFKFCLVQSSKPNEEYLNKLHAVYGQKNLNVREPCDWPERRFLEAKSKSADHHTTLKKNLCQSSISSLEISKLFDEEGRAKKTLGANSSPLLRRPSSFRVEDFEKVVSLKWPDIKNHQYHDIYYNDDNTEKMELLGTQLKNALIVEETSSRDFKEKFFKSKQQNEKSSNQTPIKNIATRKSPRITDKRKRTPSIKAIEAKFEPEPSVYRQKMPSRRTLFKTNSPRKRYPAKHQVGQKALNSSPKKRTPSKKGTMIEARLAKPALDKNSAQSQATANPNIRVQKVKKDNSDLDDKTTKKLRDAVMTAFESRNFGVDNPLFKICFRRLFNICKEYIKDFEKKAGMNDKLKALANAHVDQVIDWEKSKPLSK